MSRPAGGSASTQMRIIAVVPAAGSGVRFGSATPKQYIELDGRPIVLRTLQRLVRAGVCRIVLAVDPQARERVLDVMSEVGAPVEIVNGGATRQESVLAAVRHAATLDAGEWVAVHDAVRPCFSRALWSRLVGAVATTGAAVPVLTPTDTVHRIENGLVTETPPRVELGMAQTPQLFRLGVLLEALEIAARRSHVGTDEAGLVAAAGHLVAAVEGDPYNVKVTTRDDLVRISASRGEWEEW